MTLQEVNDFINKHRFALVYFRNDTCSVCVALEPKLKSFVNEYEELSLLIIDTQRHQEIAPHFQIYSAPALLVYVENTLYLKEAGIFSLSTLRQKIDRLYELSQR